MSPTVFISYSHKDEDWRDRLLPHLLISVREGIFEIWDDRKISAGAEWRFEIQEALERADVGILLISAHFLTSEFICNEEIPHMLKRSTQNGMRLFPVLIRSCDWQAVDWLETMQIRPKEARPLASFTGDRRNAAMTTIAQEIRRFLGTKLTLSEPSPVVLPPRPYRVSLPSVHQLPPPAADFTGREEELSALTSVMGRGGIHAIFNLRGMGGVGKTTLALKLAEQLAPLYPDAQLFLDLKGVDPKPLTVAQAMAHVIRSYKPDIRLPDNETELAALYRSTLIGRRALLLMDNAANREQVEPLIPPAGSLLLVTSRFHFMLPGLVARDLDEMSREEAQNLLLKMAPHIGNESDKIARLCGCLPLALRLAGSTLAERMDLSPSEYARRLREGKEWLGPLEAALNLSYELLNAKQRRLWRMLAVFPGTFDATAAAAIWELEIDLAKEVLWELVRCSLVEWEEKDVRYRLHDLARQFADRKVEVAERGTAQRLHAEHFLETLRNANDLYLKGGDDVLLALRLFDTEWDNVQAGYSWAANHFHEDDETAKICGDYPQAGAYLLDLRQRPRERIRWMEMALAASRQRNDKATEAAHLGELGIAYADLGEPRRAIEFYEEHLAIARDMGDRHGESQALGNLGIAYKNLGAPLRAIEFYKQHLAIARDIGDRRGEGNALGNLGNAYATLGEPRHAIEFYEKVLAVDREIGDRHGEANASWNLGLVYEKEGELTRAADLMQIRVDFEQEIGHPDAEEHAAHVQALRARIAEQSS